MLIITVIIIWPFSEHPGEFWLSLDVFIYVARNMSIFLVSYNIPGVFQENIIHAVNGSLWSLRFELLFYIILAIFGSIGLSKNRWIISIAVLLFACGMILFPESGNFFIDQFLRLGLFFTLGSLAAAYAKFIPIGSGYVVALAVAAFAFDVTIFRSTAWSVFFAYFLLWFAYAKIDGLLKFNKLPDISYGLYIYAFPIQQIMIETQLGGTPGHNLLYAAPLTVILATASWYLVESPALKLKRPSLRPRRSNDG